MKNKKGEVNYDFSKYGIEISEDSYDLMKRMLSKDPSKRPSAKECLTHEAF